MTKKYRVAKKHYRVLELVATAPTVAMMWGRSYTGVIYAIDADNLAAVKCGKTWLISLPSVTAYWGPPPYPFGPVQPVQNAITA